MGIAFDAAPDRPETIDVILNGLDRYNPESTKDFQDYVSQQCEDRTYDCYANLALLKLYVFLGIFRSLGAWVDLIYEPLLILMFFSCVPVASTGDQKKEIMMIKNELRFLLPESAQAMEP